MYFLFSNLLLSSLSLFSRLQGTRKVRMEEEEKGEAKDQIKNQKVRWTGMKKNNMKKAEVNKKKETRRRKEGD